MENEEFYEDEYIKIKKTEYEKMIDLLERFAEAFEVQKETIADLETQAQFEEKSPVLNKFEAMLAMSEVEEKEKPAYVETI